MRGSGVPKHPPLVTQTVGRLGEHVKSITWHDDVLTEKYFIIPKRDSGEIPIIKVPCILSSADEIPLEFSTELDVLVRSVGCPKCDTDVFSATCGGDTPELSNWWCLRGHRWKTHRGIFIVRQPEQLALF